jgi:hypothetical protein
MNKSEYLVLATQKQSPDYNYVSPRILLISESSDIVFSLIFKSFQELNKLILLNNNSVNFSKEIEKNKFHIYEFDKNKIMKLAGLSTIKYSDFIDIDEFYFGMGEVGLVLGIINVKIHVY